MLNACNACSGNMNVTWAKPLVLLLIASIGSVTSVSCPASEVGYRL